MFELGNQDKVIAEQFPYGRAEGVVDGAKLFAGLHFDESLDGTVVGRHFQHCRAQVAQRGVETRRNLEGGTCETVGFECGVIGFVEADVLALVALVELWSVSVSGRAMLGRERACHEDKKQVLEN